MVIEILTAILAFITAIYVYLTHRIALTSEKSVTAIKDQTEAMLRPYVVAEVYLRPNTSILNLRIKNNGKTGAENVTLELDKDFFQLGNADRNLKNLSAFSSKIDLLAPESELVFILASAQAIFSENAKEEFLPKKFTITSVYSFGHKKFNEKHHIDLNPFLGVSIVKDPLVEEIEKIRKFLEKNI